MNYMIDNRKMTERVSGFLALVLQGCVKTLKAQSINFLGYLFIEEIHGALFMQK